MCGWGRTRATLTASFSLAFTVYLFFSLVLSCISPFRKTIQIYKGLADIASRFIHDSFLDLGVAFVSTALSQANSFGDKLRGTYSVIQCPDVPVYVYCTLPCFCFSKVSNALIRAFIELHSEIPILTTDQVIPSTTLRPPGNNHLHLFHFQNSGYQCMIPTCVHRVLFCISYCSVVFVLLPFRTRCSVDQVFIYPDPHIQRYNWI